MKAAEIKPCAICRKGVMHSGVPLFYRVELQVMGINRRAVEQTAGLEQMLGSVGLARVMGPDPDIAEPIHPEPVVALVCQPCSMEASPLMLLAEAK